MDWRTFSTTEDTALPKIKSEDDADSVFLTAKALCTKSACKKFAVLMQDIMKVCLDRRFSPIRRVSPALFRTRDFFLLHDNAPALSAAKIRQFLTQTQVATLNHPPYSPDLSPPDYELFPKVKLQLKGAIFDTIEEIQKAVTDQLNKIPAEDFSNVMKKLDTRADVCITSNGSYFE